MSNTLPDPDTSIDENTGKPKSRRRIAREFAVQGIYQWLVAGGSIGFIEQQLRESDQFKHVDTKHFTLLLHGVLQHAETLKAAIQPYLDRVIGELSPVETAILLLSTYELMHQPEIPYRAIINEGIELARTFGGIDGHKYVNGVLDKLAVQLRNIEIEAQRQTPKRS